MTERTKHGDFVRHLIEDVKDLRHGVTPEMLADHVARFSTGLCRPGHRIEGLLMIGIVTGAPGEDNPVGLSCVTDFISPAGLDWRPLGQDVAHHMMQAYYLQQQNPRGDDPHSVN